MHPGSPLICFRVFRTPTSFEPSSLAYVQSSEYPSNWYLVWLCRKMKTSVQLKESNILYKLICSWQTPCIVFNGKLHEFMHIPQMVLVFYYSLHNLKRHCSGYLFIATKGPIRNATELNLLHC